MKKITQWIVTPDNIVDTADNENFDDLMEEYIFQRKTDATLFEKALLLAENAIKVVENADVAFCTEGKQKIVALFIDGFCPPDAENGIPIFLDGLKEVMDTWKETGLKREKLEEPEPEPETRPDWE